MDRSQWKLRPAREEDGDGIRELVFSVLKEHGLKPDPEGIDADLKNIAASYQVPGGIFDVLVDEAGKIAGSIGLFPLGGERCELRKMYLAPQVRGQGQGRRILEHALSEARARGFQRVELETAFVLKDAIALYERYGFRRFTPAHLGSRCDCAYYLDLARG